jgi:hypothetical protein
MEINATEALHALPENASQIQSRHQTAAYYKQHHVRWQYVCPNPGHVPWLQSPTALPAKRCLHAALTGFVHKVYV